MDAIQIFLTCPRCGNSTWYRRDDDEDGAYECAACGEMVLTEDMGARASDDEPDLTVAN